MFNKSYTLRLIKPDHLSIGFPLFEMRPRPFSFYTSTSLFPSKSLILRLHSQFLVVSFHSDFRSGFPVHHYHPSTRQVHLSTINKPKASHYPLSTTRCTILGTRKDTPDGPGPQAHTRTTRRLKSSWTKIVPTR